MIEESKEIKREENPIDKQDNEHEESQQMSPDEQLIKVGNVQMTEKFKV